MDLTETLRDAGSAFDLEVAGVPAALAVEVLTKLGVALFVLYKALSYSNRFRKWVWAARAADPTLAQDKAGDKPEPTPLALTVAHLLAMDADKGTYLAQHKALVFPGQLGFLFNDRMEVVRALCECVFVSDKWNGTDIRSLVTDDEWYEITKVAEELGGRAVARAKSELNARAAAKIVASRYNVTHKS
jgi:hypothetical protein